MANVQVCTYCVMDSSDPEIKFDASGRCNHCRNAEKRLRKFHKPGPEGEKELQGILAAIRESGKGKEYDCVIGLSGGVDSSWLAYKSKDWGLRPLVIHIDGGWNSEIAQKNIEVLVKKLGYDLYTYVVDWEEMRDLQRAYLEAALANQDVPQDHVFFAVLSKKAEELGIKYWLSGSNLVSESILPTAWGYTAMDSKQLKAVHKLYGRVPLRSYKTLSFFEYCRLYSGLPLLASVQLVAPLNYMYYNLDEAKRILSEESDWKDYGKKHHESHFTKFFQNYYLPEKFGYDKRKAHLSSLIVAGAISRDGALEELAAPLSDPEALKSDKAFILKKLAFSEQDWERIMALPCKSYLDYPSFQGFVRVGRKVKGALRNMGLVR